MAAHTVPMIEPMYKPENGSLSRASKWHVVLYGPRSTASAAMMHVLPSVNAMANLPGDSSTMGKNTNKASSMNTTPVPPSRKNICSFCSLLMPQSHASGAPGPLNVLHQLPAPPAGAASCDSRLPAAGPAAWLERPLNMALRLLNVPALPCVAAPGVPAPALELVGLCSVGAAAPVPSARAPCVAHHRAKSVFCGIA